jgi:multiple sugar transport system permease protein
MLRWTLNSLLIATGCTLLQILTCSLAGYGFARKRFWGRDSIFWFMMLQLMMPYQLTVIPVFLFLTKLKLTDTYWAFWLPFATNVFGTFLMRQAMLGIPQEYDEAAKIDGASDLQIYWKIILPMCRPTIAVLAIFAFLHLWNDFFYALIVTQANEMKTLQVGLARLQPIGGLPGVQMAGAVYAFLPTFILFITQQKRIVEGLQAGGLKG